MRWRAEIHIDRVTPKRRDVLRALGVPNDREPDTRTLGIIATALDELRASAEPHGVLSRVDTRDFARIYEGDGRNAARTPLAEIFPRADGLTLFAVTIGAPVSRRVAALFDTGDYALGGILDAAASEAAERAAEYVTGRILGETAPTDDANGRTSALAYSPGYCGWDLTGQRTLFAALEPEDIGITLTDSCLMEPVKSISGVIVTGPADIHRFNDDYDFCSTCPTHGCRDRIACLDEPGA